MKRVKAKPKRLQEARTKADLARLEVEAQQRWATTKPKLEEKISSLKKELEDGKKAQDEQLAKARERHRLELEKIENAHHSNQKRLEEAVQKAQQKRLRQVFATGSTDTKDNRSEREIDMITAGVSQLFREIEPQIRLVSVAGGEMGMTNKDYALRQNAQRRLATDLQELSQQFRKCQLTPPLGVLSNGARQNQT